MPMTDADRRAGLVLEGVGHAYGAHRVVEGVDLVVAPSEIVCLLGPSGCGKTTTLRIIAGLETLQRGRILVNGRLLADAATHVPPEQRNVSLLFQDFALFPHLTVLDNVTFGLAHLAPQERRRRAEEVLNQVGMLDYAGAYPHVLSGGQQQRIALARARAPRPRVLLMDEPFSNLDIGLRTQLRDLVLHVLKNTTCATVMVTHDPEEAMFMADRIAVMREGRIVQLGTPEQLYDSPADQYVAGLFSEINRIEGIVRNGHVDTAFGPLCAPGLGEGAMAEVLVRPEDVYLADAPGNRTAPGRVITARLIGPVSLVHLSVADNERELHLHARVATQRRPVENEIVPVSVDPNRIFVFPRQREGGAE
ncbi:MAG: ABC transporter ATP-binding protein [Alphaproteobacteria bacterium]|nr:ABC transporter ATP-binding protein [Alphaproteobacteria bacterium]